MMIYTRIHFTQIPVTIPYRQIFTRLGYSKEKTRLNPGEEKIVKSGILEAAGIIKLKGAALRLKVQSRTVDEICINGTCLGSKNFSTFAREADELLLMGATGSNAIMEKIRELSAADFSKALVFDAAASEIVDAALDWIAGYFKMQLIREGKTVSKNRFSAGYGDFDLEYQHFFYTKLDLQELGITLSPAFQLLPEKSVTAAAAIYMETEE